jgi:hypothetical protein
VEAFFSRTEINEPSMLSLSCGTPLTFSHVGDEDFSVGEGDGEE